MNCITRKLLPLFLCSSLGLSLTAMHPETIPSKDMSKKELIQGIKGLPHELKQYIVYLFLQHSALLQGFLVEFKLSKTLNVEEMHFSLAFSPTGENVLIGHMRKGDTELWNIETGKIVKKFTRCTNNNIACVGFSPDGEKAFTGSEDTTISIWNTQTEELVNSSSGYTTISSCVAFSPNGEKVFIGPNNSIASIYSTKTKELLTDLEGHRDWICCAAFSPDGEKVLTGSDDSTAHMWDANTGKLLTTFKGHELSIQWVTFSQTGEITLTGSLDKTACIWDANTGRLLRTLKGHVRAVYSVAFSPDDELCLTGSLDCTARVWNTKTGELLTTLRGHTKAIESVAWSPNGEYFITGSVDCTAHVWKRVYELSCLTPDKKERVFKQFITLFPLLERIPETSETE